MYHIDRLLYHHHLQQPSLKHMPSDFISQPTSVVNESTAHLDRVADTFAPKHCRLGILHQLQAMVEEWRSILPAEKTGVTNVDVGPIVDPFLP